MNEILNINNVHGYLDKSTGTAYINAEDVARGFGFTRGKNGVEYVMWDRVNRYLAEFGFSTQVRKDDFIPENMVYRLGFKANNETAQRFQAILADEVLPSIRKHGAYMTEETLQRAITSPDFLIKLATELKQEQNARKLAEQQVKELTPKGIFADAVNSSETSILVGELAKLLKQNGVNMGRNRLFDWMKNNGYLIKSGSERNMPTQKSMEMKLLEIKERNVANPDGSIKIVKTPKVTGKGQIYFINKLLAKEV